MENLTIPDSILEFVETKQFSAANKHGQDFLISMSKRLKKKEGQEVYQAITFGYCVEGSDECEVLEEMLRYISEKEMEKPPAGNAAC